MILKLIRAQDKTPACAQDKTPVTEPQDKTPVTEPLGAGHAEAPKKSAVDDKDRHYVRELYCQTVGDEVVLKSRANKKLWVHQDMTFAALRDLYVQAVVEACDHSEKALWERVKEVCTSTRVKEVSASMRVKEVCTSMRVKEVPARMSAHR